MTALKDWGPIEIIGVVIFGLTLIIGLILLIIGLTLNDSILRALETSTDPQDLAIAAAIELTRRCLIGAGVTMMIVVLPGLLGVFIPSVVAMKSLSIVTVVLVVLAFCVVLVLSIIPSIFIPVAQVYCCDPAKGDVCSGVGKPDSDFCKKDKGKAIASSYIIWLGFAFMVMSLIIASIILGVVKRKGVTTTTVVVTQQPAPVVVQGGYPSQPPQDYTAPPQTYDK